jgi:DNA-binding MarR family transcriptional regulator
VNSLTPQQGQILELLQDAGTTGINSYGKARKVALQLPAVIEQLQKHGYIIKSVRRRNRSVDYVLLHTPESLKKAPELIARPQGWVPEGQPTEAKPERSDVSLEEIEEKLQALRDEYPYATLSDRAIIEIRARSLLNAKVKIENKQYQTP